MSIRSSTRVLASAWGSVWPWSRWRPSWRSCFGTPAFAWPCRGTRCCPTRQPHWACLRGWNVAGNGDGWRWMEMDGDGWRWMEGMEDFCCEFSFIFWSFFVLEGIVKLMEGLVKLIVKPRICWIHHDWGIYRERFSFFMVPLNNFY